MTDRGTEKATGRRRDQQSPDGAAAGGLAADGHPLGISPERGDVTLHPAQGLDLVQQAAVVRGVGDPAEAVEAEPVRERHGHHAVAVEGAAVVPGTGGGAGLVAAAVDPDENRQTGVVFPGTGVNTLTFRVASPGMDGSGMAVTSPNERRWAVGPYAVASRTPSHGPAVTGAPKRFAPAGGSANGSPRNAAERSTVHRDRCRARRREPCPARR